MKQLFVRLVVALLTFTTGVGLDQPLSSKPARVEIARPIGRVVAEPVVAAARTPACASLVTPKPMLIFDYDPERFWPVADYAFTGKRPRGVSRDDSFFITIWQVDQADDYVSLSIFDDRGNTDLRASFALVTDRRLFFVTQPSADGFIYRFDGKFLKGGVIYDAPEGNAVLSGTLTTSKNGRTVAEWPMKFVVVKEGC